LDHESEAMEDFNKAHALVKKNGLPKNLTIKSKEEFKDLEKVREDLIEKLMAL